MEHPKWKQIGGDTKSLIDRMLLEKIPLARIARRLSGGQDYLIDRDRPYRSLKPKFEARSLDRSGLPGFLGEAFDRADP